jgi:hypothetical protein
MIRPKPRLRKMAMRFNGDVCSCGAGDVYPISVKIDAKSNPDKIGTKKICLPAPGT